MKKSSFIIKLSENGRDVLPNYHDYAKVLDKINQLILQQTSLSLNIYLDEEGQEEMWSVLEEDIVDW